MSFENFKQVHESDFGRYPVKEREKKMAEKYTELTGIETKWEKSKSTSKDLKGLPLNDKSETSSI